MNVIIKKAMLKSAQKMPINQQKKFIKLLQDIRENGPIRTNWPNYGILKGTNIHHCHLSYKWVACWIELEIGISVEVVYAGSRGNAPYEKG